MLGFTPTKHILSLHFTSLSVRVVYLIITEIEKMAHPLFPEPLVPEFSLRSGLSVMYLCINVIYAFIFIHHIFNDLFNNILFYIILL